MKIVKGDVYDAKSVADAIEGQDTVLAALGKRLDIRRTTLFYEGTVNIVAGMKEHNVKRISICSSAFVLQ